MLFFIFSFINFKKKELIKFEYNFDRNQIKLLFIAFFLFFIGIIIKILNILNFENYDDFIKNIISYNILMLLSFNLIFFYSCNAFKKKLYKKAIFSLLFFLFFTVFSFLTPNRTSTLIIFVPAILVLIYLKIIPLKKLHLILYTLLFILLFFIIFFIKTYQKQVDKYFLIHFSTNIENFNTYKASNINEVKEYYNELKKLESINPSNFNYEYFEKRYFFNTNFFYNFLDRINSYHIYDKITKLELDNKVSTFKEIPYDIIPDQIYSLFQIRKKNYIQFTNGNELGHKLNLLGADNKTTGIGPTLFGELYLNYKFLGIIIGIPLIAILANISSNFFTNYFHSPLTIPFYSTYLCYQVSNMMNFLSAHIYIFFVFFGIYFIVIIFFKYTDIKDLKNS
jgi:hypothetical protein